jgi:S1-C subfamily serine protease
MLLMALASLLCMGKPLPMQAAQPPKSVLLLQYLSVQGCQSHISYQLPRDVQRLLPSMVIVQNHAQIGSGVLISEDGHLLTAAHLVRKANRVAVYLNSGETVEGRVMHAKLKLQPDSDIAIIKIPGAHYPCLPITTEPLAPGNRIFSVGFSTGANNGSFTIQQGIVGPYRPHTARGPSALQTTLDLTPGNSGGPLLNSQGQVVGIITGKIRLGDHQIYSFGTPVINAHPGINPKKKEAD